MGYGAWNSVSYNTYAAAASSVSRIDLYKRSNKFDPTQSGQKVNIEEIKFRESRDSIDHPVSTPVMIALDVTGSMGVIPEQLTKGGLGVFVDQLLQRKPITDPHILFMGIGDVVKGDKAPLQATQFESDNRICQQLTDIYLEGGGGGNNFESYDLAWAFGAFRTQTDAWDKRREKGFLFTVGDEIFPEETDRNYFRSVFGNDTLTLPTPEKLLEECQKRWHVFHVIIAEGHWPRAKGLDNAEASWRQRLHARALTLKDYKRLPELLISAIAGEQGVAIEEILSWWEGGTLSVIRESLLQS